MQRDFKGVWIPKDIWLNEGLSVIEKVLIAEIDSLDNDPVKGCFASNEYLGKFVGVSAGRMANIISDLRKRGYVKQVFFDGRVRGLRVHENMTSVHENVKADIMDSLKQPSRKREHINTDRKPITNTTPIAENSATSTRPAIDKEALTDRAIENMKQDPYIREHFHRRAVPLENFDRYVADFRLHFISFGKDLFTDKDFRQHFLNWSEKKYLADKAKAPQQVAKQYDTFKRYS